MEGVVAVVTALVALSVILAVRGVVHEGSGGFQRLLELMRRCRRAVGPRAARPETGSSGTDELAASPSRQVVDVLRVEACRCPGADCGSRPTGKGRRDRRRDAERDRVERMASAGSGTGHVGVSRAAGRPGAEGRLMGAAGVGLTPVAVSLRTDDVSPPRPGGADA